MQNVHEVIKEASNINLLFWKALCERTRCTHCKKKMRVIKPHPGKFKHLIEMFDVDYLVHMKTTHGMEPEDIVRKVKSLFAENYDA